MAKNAKKAQSGGNEPTVASSARHGMTPWEEMDRWFDNLMAHGGLRRHFEWPPWAAERTPFGGRMPKIDVIDREHELVVKAELPGVEKKDLDVSMSDDTVTIKGSTAHEEKEEKGDYYRCEISRGTFSRTVPLPCQVDSTKARASFKDGILELTMPKASQAKRKRVEVR